MERKNRKRVVVKIGSSSLTNKNGGLSLPKLSTFVNDIALLKDEGHEVVLVSSGAVAAGFKALGYPTRPVTTEGKQAAAAVGQGLLVESYNQLLQKHGYLGAQILLTRSDFSEQTRYRNAHNTLETLLKRNVIPIINENDSVSVDELTFGDNDMLSALVAGLIHADTLLICTDTNGLYSADPSVNPDAKKFHFLSEITPEIEALAEQTGSRVGTGGMKSKIQAAKVALSIGIEVFIGRRSERHTLYQALHHDGDGTYFSASSAPLKTKKQWIAFHSGVRGSIHIDNGAKRALLQQGKSLLAPGITNINGTFQSGDVIEVVDERGKGIGKGKVRYSSAEINAYLNGERSSVHFEKEVIHRDDWVTLKEVLIDE